MQGFDPRASISINFMAYIIPIDPYIGPASKQVTIM
jgi:hypothetical protein